MLGILVSVYLMAQTVAQYRRGNYRVKRTALWLSLWTLMAILFVFPSLAVLALPILTMQDAMLSIMVVGLIVAYVLMYQMYQQTARTEQKLTELAQNMAIHNYVKEAIDDPENKDDAR